MTSLLSPTRARCSCIASPRKLITGPVPTALKNEIEAAVRSIPILALRSDGRNQQRIDNAKRNRVMLAVYLTLVSPEFIVQK